MRASYKKYDNTVFFQNDKIIQNLTYDLKAYTIFILFHILRGTCEKNLVNRITLLKLIKHMNRRTWNTKWDILWQYDLIRPLDRFVYMLNPQVAWTHAVDKEDLIKQWNKLSKHISIKYRETLQ